MSNDRPDPTYDNNSRGSDCEETGTRCLLAMLHTPSIEEEGLYQSPFLRGSLPSRQGSGSSLLNAVPFASDLSLIAAAFFIAASSMVSGDLSTACSPTFGSVGRFLSSSKSCNDD